MSELAQRQLAGALDPPEVEHGGEVDVLVAERPQFPERVVVVLGGQGHRQAVHGEAGGRGYSVHLVGRGDLERLHAQLDPLALWLDAVGDVEFHVAHGQRPQLGDEGAGIERCRVERAVRAGLAQRLDDWAIGPAGVRDRPDAGKAVLGGNVETVDPEFVRLGRGARRLSAGKRNARHLDDDFVRAGRGLELEVDELVRAEIHAVVDVGNCSDQLDLIGLVQLFAFLSSELADERDDRGRCRAQPDILGRGGADGASCPGAVCSAEGFLAPTAVGHPQRGIRGPAGSKRKRAIRPRSTSVMVIAP